MPRAAKVKPGRWQGFIRPGDHFLAGVLAFTLENM